MAHARARRPLSRLACLLAAVLVGSTLALVQAAPATAGPSLALSPSQPMPNESVLLRGALAPTGRTVSLQKYAGGRWTGVTSARTGSGGAFAFRVTATTTTTSYRVVAAATKVKRKKYAAVTYNAAAVRGVAGRATLAVLPYPMGNTSGATLPAIARFTPARPGKVVKIYGPDGTYEGKQASDGTATIGVHAPAPGQSAEFTAYTFPGNGAANYSTTATGTTTTLAQTFGDEFSGSTLDRTKWGTRVQPFFGNRKCAKPADDRVAVGGGVATLSVKKISGPTTHMAEGKRVTCKYGVWDNAMIGTSEASANPFAQAYGTFAARVAMQSARGMHGSFWLQGSGPGASEIDVVEHFGVGSTDGITTKIHKTEGTAVDTLTKGGLLSALRGAPATAYHVYSVEWTPSLYIFRINGIETFRTNRFVASVPEELILSLLTSDWNLPNMNNPSATMKVDWVRAWAHG